MNSQIEVAKHRLYDKSELSADNFKLFPGSSRDATPGQMAEQINKGISQIETGDVEWIDDFED